MSLLTNVFLPHHLHHFIEKHSLLDDVLNSYPIITWIKHFCSVPIIWQINRNFCHVITNNIIFFTSIILHLHPDLGKYNFSLIHISFYNYEMDHSKTKVITIYTLTIKR